MDQDHVVNEPTDLELAVQGYMSTGSRKDKDKVVKIGQELIKCYAGVYSPGMVDERLKKAATEELAKEDNPLPTLQEIAEKVNVSEEGIVEAMQAGSVSLKDLDLNSLKSLRRETLKFKGPFKPVDANFESIDLGLKMEGRYRCLVHLLNHLRNEERAIQVGRVSTTRNEKIPARISTAIELKTYFRQN